MSVSIDGHVGFVDSCGNPKPLFARKRQEIQAASETVT